MRDLLQEGRLDTKCSFNHGSYFPKSYIQKRKISPELEKEELFNDQKQFLYIKPGNITPKQLSKHDIFFLNPYRIHLPSVFELFKLYANDKAVLICSGGERPDMKKAVKQCAEKLGLKLMDGELLKK